MAAAMELIRPLAEEGNAEAQYYLGWIYDYELEENDETEKESLYWYELAAEKGVLKANLGASLNDFIESDELAAKLAEDAISRGILDLSEEELGPDGLYQIASYYCKEDNDKAMERYLKAAEAGDADAMHNIGDMYENGLGVEQDCDRAMSWYIDAYLKGHDEAKVRINNMLEKDLGLDKYNELHSELVFAGIE